MNEYNIGPQLKNLRKTRKLTLQFVAEKTGVSVPLLSQIENGNVTPSLKTLTKLVSYFQIQMGRLFESGEEKPRYRIFRNSDANRDARSGARSPKNENNFCSLMSSESGMKMNCSVIDLRSIFEISPAAKRKGETFLYILAGKAAVSKNDETHIVAAGDSVYFDNSVTIGVKPIDSSFATVIRIDAG